MAGTPLKPLQAVGRKFNPQYMRRRRRPSTVPAFLSTHSLLQFTEESRFLVDALHTATVARSGPGNCSGVIQGLGRFLRSHEKMLLRCVSVRGGSLARSGKSGSALEGFLTCFGEEKQTANFAGEGPSCCKE